MTTKEGFGDPEIIQAEGNVRFFLISDYLESKHS